MQTSSIKRSGEYAEPHALGHTRRRAEIDAGHGHHIERRGVMFRHVEAINASLIGGLDESEPLVEQRRKRPLAVLDVVEKSDFH